MRRSVTIIGGGTAGLTIASRISDKFDVKVLEASPNKRLPLFYKIPLLIGLLFRLDSQRYIQRKELKFSADRQIPYFYPRVFGGSSVTNGCVHTVGSLDKWQSVASKFDFTIDQLLQSFYELYTSENHRNSIKFTNGFFGQIDIALYSYLKSTGFEKIDTNFISEPGFGNVLNTYKWPFRSSVISLSKRRNFRALVGVDIRSITSTKGNIWKINTNIGEINSDFIVLSSGVFGTPMIINNHILKDNNSEDVFSKIQDHTNLRVNVVATKKLGTLNELENSLVNKIYALFSHFSCRKTLLVGTGATTAIHLDLDNDGVVETRIQLLYFSESGRHGSDGKVFHPEPGFSLSITPIYPQSKGRIHFSGKSIQIEPGYFSNPKDFDVMKKALNFCLQVLDSDHLKPFVKEIIDRDTIESNPCNYITKNFYSGHHLIGGCQDLVDKNFKLISSPGVHICDASILHHYVSSNIHSSVVLLADLFAKRFIDFNG